MNNRILELDSLRALACLVIMTSHSLSILPEMYDPEALTLIKETPLAIFRAGREAVLFFFILSGFVLALPFLRGTTSLPQYYVQRFFRLWVPYAVSLIVAIAMAVTLYDSRLPGLSAWANTDRSFPTTDVLLEHLLLLTSFSNGVYNPVLWTLVYIARITIVFPLLVFLVQRLSPKTTVLACIALSTTGFLLDAVCTAYGRINDYDMTLHYAAVFMFGGLLAKHHRGLIERYQALPRQKKWGLAAAAFLLYTHAYWLFPRVQTIHYAVPRDWIVALGITIGLAVATGSARISQLLVRQPFSFLGRISFSIYLYHAVVLLSCVHQFYGKMQIWSIWVCAWMLTLIVATLAHFAIEQPALRLGRRFSEAIGVRKMTPQPIRVKSQ